MIRKLALGVALQSILSKPEHLIASEYMLQHRHLVQPNLHIVHSDTTLQTKLKSCYPLTGLSLPVSPLHSPTPSPRHFRYGSHRAKTSRAHGSSQTKPSEHPVFSSLAFLLSSGLDYAAVHGVVLLTWTFFHCFVSAGICLSLQILQNCMKTISVHCVSF